jgi:hypothetical protein
MRSVNTSNDNVATMGLLLEADPDQTLFGCIIILCSFTGFTVISKLIHSHFTPTSVQYCTWRWKNILVSFIHSLLTGVWACLCFYRHPRLAEDLIHTYDTSSQCLVAISIGYFIHDIKDMIQNDKGKSSSALIVHHSVIILCFGIAIVTQHYIGYSVVALIVEINSIFLHGRQLLQILKVPKQSSLYRTNSLINLGTYIVCRIALLAWMTRWLVINRDAIPFLVYTIGSIGLAIMTVMNIVLFGRLLQSDFLRKENKATLKQN